MARKGSRSKQGFCGDESSICNDEPVHQKGKEAISARASRTLAILKDQGAIATKAEQRSFADFVDECIRRKKAVRKRWSDQRCADEDIISLIQSAHDAGDTDEAVWRAFLAAHFGRPSANPNATNQVESASLFVFAFGDEPYWIWERVNGAPSELRKWLTRNRSVLRSLSFGNHRKYESKKPADLWRVIKSFLDLAVEYGGPSDLLDIDSNNSDAAERFDILYRRLGPIRRFGRTAKFDFLELLVDLDLVVAEPGRCYLAGATGPKRGAQLLWGDLPPRQLDDLAVELVEGLGVSAQVIEDALCNWQKAV